MNYIESMKRLAKYREDVRVINRTLTNAGGYVKQIKGKLEAAEQISNSGIVGQIDSLLDKYYNDKRVHLGESIKSACEIVEKEYTENMRKATSDYENRMLEIQRAAKEEIQKGTNKPFIQDAPKFVGTVTLGMIATAMFAVSMSGIGSASTPCVVIGLGCLAAMLSIVTKKKKPDEEKLTALVSEARDLTRRYFGYISPIIDKAYAGLEARQNALLDKTTEEIKAEISERVFFLFENTPYGQQEYFIKLGMTASSEEDFNSIAQECLKADKTEHQIQVQNMINIETRNSINKSIEDLNRTARKIHEDNEFRARQQAEHNAQVARQNELSLKNQAKALDAQKKQREATEELEYRMRHK